MQKRLRPSRIPLTTSTLLLYRWRQCDKADLHSGQTLLIHGGAGGVGGYAIQLAKLYGARVIATAAAEHLEYVKNLGADLVLDYHAQPFEQQVTDVAVVLDLVG